MPTFIKATGLRERLLLEFRGNNNLELPLLWFANLEATSARDAVEAVSHPTKGIGDRDLT